MKYILFIQIIVVCSSVLNAQKDTITAENIYRYELKNGKATKNRIIIRQNTYNLDNQLIKQIDYDSIANIRSSTLYFYEKDLLISIESFGTDFVIDSVRRISYNGNGTKAGESLYAIHDSIPRKTASIEYIYDKENLSKEIAYSNKKKWKTKTVYQSSGNIRTKTQLFKKGSRPDGLKTGRLHIFLKEKIQLLLL